MKKLILLSLTFIFLVLGICYYAFQIETKKLIVKQYKLNGTKDQTTIRVVQLSDIHLSNTKTLEDLQRIVNTVNEQNADLVVFTGDLIDKAHSYSELDGVAPILSQIVAQKYAVYGNHDIGGGAIRFYDQLMSDSGFILLNNSYDLIDFNGSQLAIRGYADALLGNPDYSLEVPEADYQLALLHEPDVANNLEDKVDLILSGHSHGGQVSLPFIGPVVKPSLAKHYTKEFYELEDSLLYVNTGIGTTRIHARLFVEPMIALFEITF